MNHSPLPVAQIKAELFRALSHPLRVRALEVLARSEKSVSELAAELDVDVSHLSQQLAVLRRADIVATRREGNTINYSVANSGIGVLLATARELIIASLQSSSRLLSELDTDETPAQ